METFFKLGEEDFRELIKTSSYLYKKINVKENPQLNNINEVFLSNGDKLNIRFNDAHLPHLLGFKNLSNLSDKTKSSLAVFRNLISDSDYRERIIEKINSNNWEYSGYMSHQYYLKTKYISNVLKAPFPKEVYFVCKYDSECNLGSSASRNYSNCEYYIGRKEPTGDISLVGYVKNDNEYVPRTNRVLSKQNAEEELKVLLKNQKICYIDSIRIFYPGSTEPITSYMLYDSDKMDTLQNMITLANKTGAVVDCASKFLYTIKRKESDKISNIDLRELIEGIALSTSKGEITDIDEDSLEKYGSFKDVLNHLISSVNDRLCSRKQSDSANISYTQLRNSFNKIVKQIDSLESKLAKLELKNKELEKANREIKSERDDLLAYKIKSEKKIAKLELKINNEEKKDE